MSRGEGSGETFLGRWSRLKQQGDEVDADLPPPSPEQAAPAHDSPADDLADDLADDEILSELGLPHPNDLQPGDDISGFMAKAVPARLRRLALRQLWRANPVLANVDGLVEYGEDYTDSAMVIENMQTLYQVGKGMFVAKEVPADLEEDTVEGLSEAADTPSANDDDDQAPASDEPPDHMAEGDDTETDAPDGNVALAAAEAPPVAVHEASAAPEPQPLPANRRMRFT